MRRTRARRLRASFAAALALGFAFALGLAACAHAPSQQQIESSLHAIDPAFAACRDRGGSGSVQLDLIIVDKGTVGSAKIIGALAHTPAGDCLEAAARNARFPHFHGAPIRFIWPIDLH